MSLTAPHVPLVVPRPVIIRFTESLSPATLSFIHSWIRSATIIDTMLVIGTSTEVYPGTAYIEAARQKGAKDCGCQRRKRGSGITSAREVELVL